MVNMGQEIRGEIFLSRVLCALQAAPLKIPLVFSRNKPTFQVTGHSAQSCQCSFWLRWCFPGADLYRTLTSYWLIINKGGCWPHRVTVDFNCWSFCLQLSRKQWYSGKQFFDSQLGIIHKSKLTTEKYILSSRPWSLCFTLSMSEENEVN